MRHIRLAPLALLVFAAACSEDTLHTPSAPETSDEALYRSLIENAQRSSDPIVLSPELTDEGRAALAPPPAGVTDVVANGSFETGDFSGWTATSPGNVPWPWAVAESGEGTVNILPPFLDPDLDVTEPQDGDWVAWHGWEAGEPGDFELRQTLSISSGSATLTWEERLQWDFSVFGSNFASQPKTHTVEIQDPNTNTPLATFRSFSTGTQADSATGDTGWQSFTVDVSAFAGQTVDLVFTQRVLEGSTGAGQVEIDHVHLLVSGAIPVEVDIKPGSETNPVNTRSRGVLPVAILTTDDFDAADVDASTVTLGDDDENDTSVATRGRSGKLQASLEDVDDDGDLDLVLHFSVRELTANGDLTSSTTELFISGATVGGGAITGSDQVRVLR